MFIPYQERIHKIKIYDHKFTSYEMKVHNKHLENKTLHLKSICHTFP